MEINGVTSRRKTFEVCTLVKKAAKEELSMKEVAVNNVDPG